MKGLYYDSRRIYIKNIPYTKLHTERKLLQNFTFRAGLLTANSDWNSVLKLLQGQKLNIFCGIMSLQAICSDENLC